MIRPLAALACAVLLAALPGNAAARADADTHTGPGPDTGPDTGPVPVVEAIPVTMLGPGDAQVGGIKDQALIRTSPFGYVYIAGQQHSRLTVTYLEDVDRLRYRDLGTQRLRSYPDSCVPETVTRGVSVLCAIPDEFAETSMFVQVWPRLGNDRVDGAGLPERFRLWVLADAGADVVRCGAGDCFVNGAKGADQVFGGPGDDWLRGGPGRNAIDGGGGVDRIALH